MLADACVQTARASNTILSQLWVDGCLAMYGFYDALSIFSSTLVLMISSAMEDHEVNGTIDDDGIGVAWSLLRSMRDDGNVPASDYYEQLVQLKDALKEACEKKKSLPEPTPQTPSKANGLHLLLAASGTENTQAQQQMIPASGTGMMQGFSAANREDVVTDPLNDQFLNGFWAQSQVQTAAWAPAAFESMFAAGTTEQMLWDLDWESGGMI